MGRVKRSCAILLAVLGLTFALPAFALTADSPATASTASSTATDSNVIRIGLSEYPGYGYVDDNGNLAGIDVEYAYKIAEYANLKIQIVLIPDAETYFASLDDGRVDVLFDTIKTDERQQKYLYASHESGNTPNSVYVRNDDNRFQYGNTDQLKDIVYGSEQDSYVTTLFQQWCEEHGFTPTIRAFADSDAINAALDAGEIDAGVYGTSNPGGYQTILQFSSTPYYCIFRHDDKALKIKIDDAMDQILSEDPLYKTKLIEKYTATTRYDMDALTATEQAYIQEHPTLKVAVIENDEPYYSQNQNGIGEGILPDYYTRISSLTGLQFQYVTYKTHAEAEAALDSGQADILGMYSDGLAAAYNSGLRLTNPYATVNAVEVTRAGTDFGSIKTVAIKSRSLQQIAGTIASQNATALPLANASDCFDAVKSGRADAMICGLPSASWLINQTNSSAYSINPLSSVSLDLCGALRYEDSTLGGILNKAISVSQYSFNGIVTNNTLQQGDWRATISRIPPSWIALFAVVMLALVASLVFALASLSRRHKEAAAVAIAKAENDRREIQLAAIEAGNEQRNKFFSNISHDMRTPLNAIIGFSDLAQETASPETKDYLTKIQTSGNLLLGLINDTLTLSKANSDKILLNPQPENAVEMLNSLMIPIREAAQKKDIEFYAKDDTVQENVIADRLNIQKIFLNLLSNAVKYTPEGGHVSFLIRNDPPDSDDPDTVFTVKDDGQGISKEFLPHIYEPFEQESEAGVGSGGTGLGLSIVKQLVDLMDGSIDVESEEGKGTTFTVRLHLKKAPDTATRSHVDSDAGKIAELSGKKILLCEDNQMNAQLAQALLQSKGITATIAPNGKAGVETFSASAPGEFSAILMDVRMPVMDGVQAAKAIRTLDRADAKSIAIIAMTADAFEDDVRRCLSAGMNEHLSKPIDKDKLYAVLTRYCS